VSKALDKHKKDLKGLVEGIPYKEIAPLKEFKNASYDPEIIRQERVYTRPSASMQAVGRFLMERGTVEILPSEHTTALFTEIHWASYKLKKYAAKKYKTPAEARAALVEARKLVSRMEAAEEELFIANRRLIASCVKPFFWIGQVWLSDFLQEGSKALSNAIRKFDFTRGTPFYAYAKISIQNRLRNFFRDHVRSGALGIKPTQDMMKIKQIKDKWMEENPEPPPIGVLSMMTGITEEKIKKLRPLMAQWERMPGPPLSLDQAVGDSNTPFHELVEDTKTESAPALAEKAEVWEAIKQLPERSRKILQLRFIEGRTLEETGEMLDLTRARIKQIQDESLKKLQHILKSLSDD